MFETLSVARKLSLLPICALAGIVALAAVLLHEIDLVYDSAGYSTVNTVPSVLVLDRAADALMTIEVKTWQQAAIREPATLAALESKIAAAMERFGAALKDYEPLISDDKDKALLQADREDLEAIGALSRKASALSAGGKSADAVELLTAQEAALQKAADDLDAHRRYNETLGKQGAADAAAVKSRAVLWGLGLAVLTVAVIGALGYYIARSIRRQLGGEPRDVAAVAGRVAQGDFSSTIALRSGDSKSLFAAVARMQSELQAREAADRAAAAEKAREAEERLAAASENARVKTALDRVTVGAMLADNDGKIIYANEFARNIFRQRAAEIRRHLPQFDPERIVGQSFDLFHANAAHQRNLLARLAGPHTTQIKLGGATLKFIASPVTDAAGKRVGTVVQWNDRTDEVDLEEEVNDVVSRAVAGDLTVRLVESGKDGFFKVLAQGVNNLIGNVGDLVGQMALAAGEVRTGAEEISRGNMDLSQRTEEQASSLEQTAASMEQMTTTVKHNADNATQANQLAAAAREQAERGGQVVGTAVNAMNEINIASKRIADIIGVIDDIAFQTNLLALNAAVEAARAGEQGRGFAVVASEVRNLASRSADAAKEIKSLIQDSVGKVAEGATLVEQSGKVLAEIMAGVKKVTDVMAEITVSSREQASGIDQVNKAVSSMDVVTQQNAALVEQASAASQTLTEQAANLTQLISRYQFDAAATSASLSSGVPKAAPATTAGSGRGERRSAARPWSGQAAPARPAPAPAKAEGTRGDTWTEF